MIGLGLLLLILGLVLGIGLLVTLGIVLLLIGLVLNFAPIGRGRRYW